MNEKEKKNQEYLENVLKEKDTSKSGQNYGDSKKSPPKMGPKDNNVLDNEYSNISLNILPAGNFYKKGTKIAIRAAKVSEIQAYSMVDDNNFVDITEKMNDLLSRCLIYTYPDGERGSYRDIKDSDRVFLIFMIRELTFQGGNTLTKNVTCDKCDNDFNIPFRSTPSSTHPTTFELHKPNEDIKDFYNKETQTYELIHNDVSYNLAPPTIGIQEDFYIEIKRNVEGERKPDVAFMKIMPFLLYDKNSINEKEIKKRHKEFKGMEDMELFQGLNEIVNNMTVGIKGLKMKCSECSQEVYTDLTFPGGASTLFELPNILDKFRR